jgi:hypothetical protein
MPVITKMRAKTPIARMAEYVLKEIAFVLMDTQVLIVALHPLTTEFLWFMKAIFKEEMHHFHFTTNRLDKCLTVFSAL